MSASFASRSAAYGCSGAAGTAHPLATLAAIDTLKRGGSAVDAAIAANACLGFLEPTSSGLGGDCFAMIWEPKLNKSVSLAGSGRCIEARASGATRVYAAASEMRADGMALAY